MSNPTLFSGMLGIIIGRISRVGVLMCNSDSRSKIGVKTNVASLPFVIIFSVQRRS